MNAVFLGMMNRKFEIYRIERVSNGAGGWPETKVLLGTISGRLRPMSGRERIIANSEDRETSHVLYVPYDSSKAGELGGKDILRGDFAVLGDLKVEILGINDPSQAHEHLEIDCIQKVGLE